MKREDAFRAFVRAFERVEEDRTPISSVQAMQIQRS